MVDGGGLYYNWRGPNPEQQSKPDNGLDQNHAARDSDLLGRCIRASQPEEMLFTARIEPSTVSVGAIRRCKNPGGLKISRGGTGELFVVKHHHGPLHDWWFLWPICV